MLSYQPNDNDIGTQYPLKNHYPLNSLRGWGNMELSWSWSIDGDPKSRKKYTIEEALYNKECF